MVLVSELASVSAQAIRNSSMQETFAGVCAGVGAGVGAGVDAGVGTAVSVGDRRRRWCRQ